MAVSYVYAGTTATVTATFRDVAGGLADPTAVALTSVSPTGTTAVLTPTHASTGVYTASVPFTTAGSWWIVAAGSGLVSVVNELLIDVLSPHA